MEWYWWVLIGIVASLIIGQFVGSFIGFRFIIPKKERSLED